MPKIICTRPNASLLISGVKFTPLEDGSGIISEEISDEAAELFLSIPGYALAEEVAPKQTKSSKAAPAAKNSKPAAAQDEKTATTDVAAPAPAPAPAAPAAAADAAGDEAKK